MSYLDLLETASARVTFGAAVLQLQEPHDTGQRRHAAGLHQHLRGQRGLFPDTRYRRRPFGPSTPNCQRDWFLPDLARYG